MEGRGGVEWREEGEPVWVLAWGRGLRGLASRYRDLDVGGMVFRRTMMCQGQLEHRISGRAKLSVDSMMHVGRPTRLFGEAQGSIIERWWSGNSQAGDLKMEPVSFDRLAKP